MAEMRIKRDLVYDCVLIHGVVTNTLVVSDVFGRLHKNVLQSVRVLRNTHLRAGRDISGMFIYDRWIEKNKRNRPIFVLSQQGFDHLAKCFTNKDDKWLKAYELIITAFHRAQNIQTNSDQSKQPCSDGSRPKPTKLTVFSSKELARFVDNDWYVSSHMVAAVFDKEHSHLVFKIRRLIAGLGEGAGCLSFR
jgi:phage regulator Rha-like protein